MLIQSTVEQTKKHTAKSGLKQGCFYMSFTVLAGGAPMPDVPSHLSSSTLAPGALEQICRSPSHTYTQHTLRSQKPPVMPDTSPLGGPVWKMALNHQGFDIKSPDWGESSKSKSSAREKKTSVLAFSCPVSVVCEAWPAMLERRQKEPRHAVKWLISHRGNPNLLNKE